MKKQSEKGNPLHQEIVEFGNPKADSWRTFSEVLAATVREWADLLGKRVLDLGYSGEKCCQ